MSCPVSASSKMVGGVLAVVRIALLACAVWAVLLVVLQRSVVFPGRFLEPERAADAVRPGVRQVWLETSFGNVEAWFLDASRNGEAVPAMIFAHGNAELIEDGYYGMQEVRSLGVSVLQVEFPGYGHSGGKPSRRSLSEAFNAAFDWLTSLEEVDGRSIVVMGRSLGGGVAGDLALSRPARALILQSTFASTAAMAWEGFRAPAFLIRDRFDNETALRGFSGPVLLFHGVRDEVIPFRHAERLAATREDVDVIRLQCGHNDCFGEWPKVVDHVGRFLEDVGVLGVQGADADTAD